MIHKIIILLILFAGYINATEYSEYLVKLSLQNLHKSRNTNNTDSLITSLMQSKITLDSQKLFTLNDDDLDSWIFLRIEKKNITEIQKLFNQNHLVHYQRNNRLKIHTSDKDPLYYQQCLRFYWQFRGDPLWNMN